jgi:hypothetical protein
MSDLQFGFEGGGVYNLASGLTNMNVTPSTPASNFSNFPADAAGSDSHWIATGPMANGTNLAAQAWKLKGKVRLDSWLPLPSSNPNEAVRFSVGLYQNTWQTLPSFEAPIQAPEPETYLMMAAGLGCFAFLRRQKHSKH